MPIIIKIGTPWWSWGIDFINSSEGPGNHDGPSINDTIGNSTTTSNSFSNSSISNTSMSEHIKRSTIGLNRFNSKLTNDYNMVYGLAAVLFAIAMLCLIKSLYSAKKRRDEELKMLEYEAEECYV